MQLICQVGLICMFAACPDVARAESGSCSLPNQREVTDCLSSALSQAQDTLKRYDTAAEEALRASPGHSTDVKDFADASANWTKYRNRECDAVADQFTGGTAGVPLYFSCATNLTKARTHEVWANFLEPFGGAAPLLPEPGGPAATP